MDYIFIKICIICALSAWVWVDLLTAPRGLFEGIKAYYPKRLRDKPLGCSRCFGGWLSIIVTTICFIQWHGHINLIIYAYILFAPIFTMAMIHIIKK